MSREDAVGHAAYAILALGMVGLAFGNELGWIARLLGEAVWVFLGFRLRLSSVWSWGIGFCLIDAVGALRALG